MNNAQAVCRGRQLVYAVLLNREEAKSVNRCVRSDLASFCFRREGEGDAWLSMTIQVKMKNAQHIFSNSD